MDSQYQQDSKVKDPFQKDNRNSSGIFLESYAQGKSPDSAYDIIIKGGTIYDGTPAKPYVADIGIEKDKIVAIGNLSEKAHHVVDATNLFVTPGFIDIHTHCDLTFERMGRKRYAAYFLPSWKGNYNYLYQGVTTVVTGNCGYGYADTGLWSDIVDSVRFGTNVYHLAPHGMIRQELFGQDQPRELTIKQLDTIKGRVAEEMENGAVGISTGLEYAPGLLATTDELIEVAKVAKKYGGIYTTHLRDESGEKGADGEIGVIRAIKEAVEIGRRAEIPIEISHLKISEPINDVTVPQILETIETARLEGIDITADQYPYDAGSTFLNYLLPDEFKTATGVKDSYKTKDGKAEMKRAVEKVFSYMGPEKTIVTMYPGKKVYEGKSVKEIAEIEGMMPSEAYVHLVCEGKSSTAVFFITDITIVEEIMKNDRIITASDGWTVPKNMTQPHPRIYGTFPRKLRKHVIEENLMNFEQAVRSMTAMPAEKFNMKGRGKIAVENFADIAVIDPHKITDHATYEKPHQYAEGIAHLFVNGKQSITNGKATGKRGGRALRRS